MKNWKNIFWFMLSLLMAITACNKASNSNPEPEASSEFDRFYERFHQDSLYQIEHITFPLDGLPGMILEENDSLSHFKWQAKDWRFQKKVDFEAGLFHQKRTNTNGTITELICDNDGFCLERRFAKIGREWYLIYFVNMNFRGNPSK